MNARKRKNNIVSFAVLTGGLSTRFGQNKLTFKIDDKSVLDIVLEKIPPHFPLYIIGEKHTTKKIQTFNDIRPGIGPLGGIYTALKKIDSSYIFVLGGDMPFIKEKLISEMIKLTEEKNTDAIVPINKGFYEPLFAVYSNRVLKIIEEQMERNEFKISELYQKLQVFRVEPEIWKRFDPAGETFININKTSDLKNFNGIYKKSSD